MPLPKLLLGEAWRRGSVSAQSPEWGERMDAPAESREGERSSQDPLQHVGGVLGEFQDRRSAVGVGASLQPQRGDFKEQRGFMSTKKGVTLRWGKPKHFNF